MSNRSGGIKGGIKGMDNNIYFDPKVAQCIIDQLTPEFPKNPMRVLDACAGRGALGEAVYNYYRGKGEPKIIHYQDIQYPESSDKKIGGSILDYKPLFKYDIIITNPPFTPVTFALAVYKHLMSLLTERGVLIFFINNVFMYQGWERGRELKYSKSYFLPRYIFDTKENKEKKRLKNIERVKAEAKKHKWNDLQVAAKIKKTSDTVLTDVSVLVCPAENKHNNFLHVPREIVK
jgi:hypothetical protein